jgi:phytoene desaturase (3,4-didehydrolycopene-forming)
MLCAPADDYQGSWQRACDAGTLCERPNFYVHCPGRTDPSAAPSGGDSVMILLPVGNLQEANEGGTPRPRDRGRERSGQGRERGRE